jgi:hypothetical protein
MEPASSKVIIDEHGRTGGGYHGAARATWPMNSIVI